MPLDDELSKVDIPQHNKVRCLYDECSAHGGKVRCYLHTYVLCGTFKDWYENLDNEEIRKHFRFK